MDSTTMEQRHILGNMLQQIPLSTRMMAHKLFNIINNTINDKHATTLLNMFSKLTKAPRRQLINRSAPRNSLTPTFQLRLNLLKFALLNLIS